MKTREEVEALKRDWASDSCWDIEDTEGFEEYREELLQFSTQKKAEWAAAWNAQQAERARKMGVDHESQIFHYLCFLEGRVAHLEELLGK